METKERQARLGEGKVTLEVSNPRELKRQTKYKRSEVVSLHHCYPVSQYIILYVYLINKMKMLGGKKDNSREQK